MCVCVYCHHEPLCCYQRYSDSLLLDLSGTVFIRGREYNPCTKWPTPHEVQNVGVVDYI